jgi:uncharacterized protein
MLGELNEAQIEQVLRSEVVGRLGCHAHGRTYVVPVTYAYDGGCIYGHSAEGMKVRLMRANPNVCFEVDNMESMANWRSVIAWGVYEELSGEEASRAMQLLISRLMPLTASETGPSLQGEGTASSEAHRGDTAGKTAILFRIRLQEKTGRFEKR